MTPERVQQIEELYHAVREKTAEERAALLAHTDPELRREVESLLAKRTGGEFLDRPALQNAPDLLETATVTENQGGPVPGALPYRKQTRRGWNGRGLSGHRHAIRPRRRPQDHS